jgi:hypothetical protein
MDVVHPDGGRHPVYGAQKKQKGDNADQEKQPPRARGPAGGIDSVLRECRPVQNQVDQCAHNEEHREDYMHRLPRFLAYAQEAPSGDLGHAA